MKIDSLSRDVDYILQKKRQLIVLVKKHSMDIKITAIVCIALVLITITWIGYYTNWLIHVIVTIYGWYPVILFELLILVMFSALVITLK